jgi:S1-C subfamily serine protease
MTGEGNRKSQKFIIGLLLVFIVVIGGAFAFYYVQSSQQLSSLNNSVAALKKQVGSYQLETANGTYPGAGYFSSSGNSTLAINTIAIYNYANASVVTIQGQQASAIVLGSGFVVAYAGSYYIITNFHVVDGDTGISVTFSNGDAYAGNVVGTDAYSDLAILSVSSAPFKEFHPLAVVSSSNLQVGAPVVAIGNPFGLSGSVTAGIVSQVGRTIFESTSGNFPIADVIQIDTPINPGNSGGPLLNSIGEVVGMTTAIVNGSQGVGFAIPSDTILREIYDLVTTGSYKLHPYLGISGVDMSYDIAQATGSSVTYGVLIETVVANSPAANAGLKGGTTTKVIDGQQIAVGGDIIVSLNGTRITNSDALSSWLEEHALPNQIVQVGIIRSGTNMVLSVTLGARPPP